LDDMTAQDCSLWSPCSAPARTSYTFQRVFENLKAAVEAAGGGFRDIFKLNVYVVDVSKLADYREVRDRYIDVSHPPTSTVVQVAALFRSEFMIEVEAVASLQA
jgi:2-iminobutanoate/2-iminopropanoate deaminase